MVGNDGGPRMLRLTALYADLWNTGYLGGPETLLGRRAKLEAACREVGREPATIGVTALIGLWFADLQPKRPTAFESPLTGSVEEIAQAMHGYGRLGVEHIMFQCAPPSPEARRRLTEALRLYRAMENE